MLEFNDFFKFTGLKQRSTAEITKMLKEAIKNSERKEYHSKYEVMKWEEAINTERKKSQPKIEIVQKLPSSEEQFRKLYENIPSYKKFIHVTPIKKEEKGESSFNYEEDISKE